MPTEEEIEAAKTPAGGWTKAQLAEWGVAWPPERGWRKRLVAHGVVARAGNMLPSLVRPDVTADDLLRKVVGAVVSAGHASDLYDFPDVLEYFGARTPEPDEIAGHHPRSTVAR